MMDCLLNSIIAVLIMSRSCYNMNLYYSEFFLFVHAGELERVGYYDALKSLIEELYYNNDRTPVSIVVVSYGGPVSHYFLTSGIVSQTWKDKFVGNYITIGGAWSGGNFLLQMLISSKLGLGEKIFPILLPGIISDALAKLLRPLFRSFQSTYYLLPRASLWKDTVIVETPNHKLHSQRLRKSLSRPWIP